MRLIDILRLAGWPEGEIGNALGVIALESGGDPAAHNGAGEDSWGLFQINREAHPQHSVAQLCDPLYNATVARQLWQARGNCYDDWWHASLVLGICPHGAAQHSIGEYQWLADLEMYHDATPPSGWTPERMAAAILAAGALALLLE